MEIKELKTKLKVTFPEESEIFMAEEFYEELHKYELGNKAVELDFSNVESLDTVFFQIAVSLIKTINTKGAKVSIKSSEPLQRAENLYGLSLDNLTGGD